VDKPLPIEIQVACAPQPGDGRSLPPGVWRRCTLCGGTGEALRYRTLFALRDGWRVSAPAGVGVCPLCGGWGYARA
jgi:hypothetical protein